MDWDTIIQMDKQLLLALGEDAHHCRHMDSAVYIAVLCRTEEQRQFPTHPAYSRLRRFVRTVCRNG